MRYRLTTARIRYFEEYEAADREAFALLIQPLIKLKYEIAAGRDNLNDLFPDYEKVFWSPDDRKITDHVDAKGTVPASVLVHHAMHTLCTERYGKRLLDDAAMTLLGESLASLTGIYFSFRMFENAGLGGEQACQAFAGPKPFASPKAFVRSYEQFLDEKPAFMRSLAREILGLFTMLSGVERDAIGLTPKGVRTAKRHLARMEHPWLATRLDVTNNYLFAKYRCRRPLDAQRIRTARRELDRILEADTMAGIVRRVTS